MQNAIHSDAIHIGRYVASGQSGEGVRFLCDAPELDRHVDRPWFRAYAAERLDIPRSALEGSGTPSGGATVSQDLLARHACVCGATGSGKTRLALHLLAEQMRAGCSVVMLDPKIETIRHLMILAYQLGMEPGQVTVLSPHFSGAGAPGWNPLDARASSVSPAQAAADGFFVLRIGARASKKIFFVPIRQEGIRGHMANSRSWQTTRIATVRFWEWIVQYGVSCLFSHSSLRC